jgi:hypothetical protein
MDRR